MLIPALFITFIDNYYSERTNTYINNQVQTYASYIFSELVSNSVINYLNENELLMIKYNQSGKVESAIVNTKITNQILADVGKEIRNYLTNDELLKAFGEVFLPLGYLFSKNIFATKGPKIKVTIKPMGTYKLDIHTSTDLKGINNSVLEVYLSLKVDLEAFLPLQKQVLKTDTKIILASQLIQGEVPRYYYTTPWFNPFIPEDN